MEREQDLADYRARLLTAVKAGASRSACSAADPIQVFVNQQCVGRLSGNGEAARLHVQVDTQIDSVQLRTEDGVLLGTLLAPGHGLRTSRISFMGETMEVQVQNYTQGGSVKVMSMPAPSWWRIWGAVGDQAVSRPAAFAGPGMRSLVLTQCLLAVALVALVADRITGWMPPVPPPLPVTQTGIPSAAPVADVVKIEQQLGELSQLQVKMGETIQAQQQGMAQIQRTMAKLSSTQESVVSSVLTVKQELEQRRKGVGREADRLTRVLMDSAHSAQTQREAEIHSLTLANDRLSHEVTHLDQANQELKKRLKSTGVDVSKATP